MYVVPDLAPVRIGPLALAGERAWVALVLLAALVVAEAIARRRGRDADWAWGAVGVGLMAARLAWVVAHPGAYLARPLEIVQIWQGGFVASAGLAAGVLWAAWRLRVRGASLRELAAPAGAAAVVAVAALALLPVAPQRPGLDRIDAAVTRLTGESAPVEAWRGVPTVVNLWATWCGPCRRELPMLIDELGGRDDVRLALVSQGEDAATVLAYLQAQGLPADDVWTDPSGALGRALSLVGLPTTVFVDADGAVREVTFGELSRARLADALGAIVAAP